MGFKTRRALKEEILELQYRVKELEHRLCPNGLHDWKLVDSNVIYIGAGEFDVINQYRCMVCGKEKSGI